MEKLCFRCLDAVETEVGTVIICSTREGLNVSDSFEAMPQGKGRCSCRISASDTNFSPSNQLSTRHSDETIQRRTTPRPNRSTAFIRRLDYPPRNYCRKHPAFLTCCGLISLCVCLYFRFQRGGFLPQRRRTTRFSEHESFWEVCPLKEF